MLIILYFHFTTIHYTINIFQLATMAMSKIAALSLLLAFAEARFGQEQIPVAAVAALGQAGFGGPGVAATIAGSIPGSLLAAAGPCSKVRLYISSSQ